MKPALLILYFILTSFFSGFSQNKHKMVVWDSVTRKGVPYVTVKMLHQEGGTYADETGNFEVIVSATDSLLITGVGYEPKIIVPLGDTILLEPIVIRLHEIKVKPVKEQTVGLFKSKTAIKFYFTSSQNYELVLKILIPESRTSYRIKGVELDALNTKAKSLARLHIYSQNKDGLPDKELLTEDIIINKAFQANSVIDLSRFNLILEDRVVFVGIEAIKGDITYKPHSGDCIGFGLTFDKNQPITYSRTLIDPDYLWRLNFSQSWAKFPGNRSNKPANLKVSLIID